MDHGRQAPGASPPVSGHLYEEAVDRITAGIMADERTRHLCPAHLPDRGEVLGTLDLLLSVLYPGFTGPRDLTEENVRQHVAFALDSVSRTLFEQVARALRYQRDIDAEDEPNGRQPARPTFNGRCADCDARGGMIVSSFLSAIPEIRRMLSLDVQAAYDGDPAARHTDEAILCYPGVLALSIHRLAHELYRHDVPLIPRIMSEHAHSLTGIDIHPGARIGKSFFIDHGTGVVIGETTVIGEHCKVYQGVTLGAKSFPKDERGRLMRDVKRHPTLEDHVTVYAGATILGGDTVIGAGSVINGGVFLTSSVPTGHVVRAPKVELTLRSNPEMPPGMYAI